MKRHPEGIRSKEKKEAMRKGLWVAASLLVITALVMGCPQPPEGGPVGPRPDVGIYVASHTVVAGSSFMVCGEFFPPGQKVWAKFEWQASDSKGATVGYSEAEDNGFVSLRIPIPEDIVPGDYEVEVYLGKHLDDRELIATLPIHVEARR